MSSEIEGKKILILAGQVEHCKLIETAREMGLHTVVADWLDDSPGKRIADEAVNISILDVDDIIAYCKEHNVDGIANYSNDLAPRVVQAVSAELGYPPFAAPELIDIFSDKKLFKETCRKCGVDVVPEYSYPLDPDEQIEYPAIVKPVDSHSNKGMSVCHDEQELKQAIEHALEESRSGQIIIERYMGGCPELTIHYLVVGDEPYLISLGDRNLCGEKNAVEHNLSCTIEPSWTQEFFVEKVDPKIKGMIRELGIRNTLVFVQGFLCDDKVMLFDPALRSPGNEYDRILKTATGADPMRSVITYAITGQMDDCAGRYAGCHDLNGKCSLQYMINCRPGTIAQFCGLDEIAAFPGTVHIAQKYEVGDSIEETGDTRQRALDISLLVDRNADAVNEAIDFVNDHLRIIDENGEDMIISPFDFRRVQQHYPWANA